jgi:hypothetical protein
MTVPTTRPRSSSAASVPARGTTSWAATAVTPTSMSAAASPAKDGATAARTSAPADATSIRPVNRRRVEQVAERDEQQQPDGVADLGRGDEQAGGALADAEVAADGLQERLRVVEVGYRRGWRPTHRRRQP